MSDTNLIDLSHTTPPASIQDGIIPSELECIRARNDRLAAGLQPAQARRPVILGFPNSVFADDPENEVFSFEDRYGLCIVGYAQAAESALFDIQLGNRTAEEVFKLPQLAHSTTTPSTWLRFWAVWNSDVPPAEISARFPPVDLSAGTVDLDVLSDFEMDL
ncbi:hypothetical protein BDZ89DRAFT_1052130, partial [Hymenopellis radicata]